MRFVRPPAVYPGDYKRVHIVRDPAIPFPNYMRLDGQNVVTLCGKNPTRKWEDVAGYVPCKVSLCSLCRGPVYRELYDCTPWSSTCARHP